MISNPTIETESMIAKLRAIRDKMSADTSDLTFEERRKYFKEQFAKNTNNKLKPHLTESLK